MDDKLRKVPFRHRRKRTPAEKDANSQRMYLLWADPSFRSRQSASHKTPSVIASAIANAKKGTAKLLGCKRPDVSARLKITNIGNQYGKDNTLTEEHKEILRQYQYAHPPKQETREKISRTLTGKTQSPETIEKRRQSLLNHPTSPETREKIRIKRLKQILPVKDSKPEKQMQAILDKLNISYIKHPTMKTHPPYQCDLYLPRQNIIIEVDGIYPHKYPYGKQKDAPRTKELQELGYRVLRFWHSSKKPNKHDGKILDFDEQSVFTRIFTQP
jgi:very-short-patch-repair endonuclease